LGELLAQALADHPFFATCLSKMLHIFFVLAALTVPTIFAGLPASTAFIALRYHPLVRGLLGALANLLRHKVMRRHLRPVFLARFLVLLGVLQKLPVLCHRRLVLLLTFSLRFRAWLRVRSFRSFKVLRHWTTSFPGISLGWYASCGSGYAPIGNAR